MKAVRPEWIFFNVLEQELTQRLRKDSELTVIPQ